jgi:DNA polymerase-4
LDSLGIKTIGDLSDARREQALRHLFGQRLHWIQELARGCDREPVVADHESKSLSHESTFERDSGDPAYLERVLRGFLRMLARDLRQEDLAAGTCTVKLKDVRFAITTKQRPFPRPLNYDPDMWPTVRQTLHALLKPGIKYRLAGLALTSLTPAAPGLFDRRRAKAIQTMDAIVARYGARAMGLGGVTSADVE